MFLINSTAGRLLGYRIHEYRLVQLRRGLGQYGAIAVHMYHSAISAYTFRNVPFNLLLGIA